MRLPTDPRLPIVTSNDEYVKSLNWKLTDLLRQIANHVNAISDGIGIAYNAQSSAPTTGKHAQGDFVRNSAPTELGSAGSKYIILGWTCVASGTAGTWKECRVLTGA